jgi:formamidopyrimidine-DNA glycosylase
MPELPDITIYVEALNARIRGRILDRIVLKSPFLLRSVDPPLSSVEGRLVQGVSRLGKRLVFDFGEGLFMVIHLMIAGRFRWRVASAKPSGSGRSKLAEFLFDEGVLVLTEAGSKKRASLQLVRGLEALASLDPGGAEPLQVSLSEFCAVLRKENHTVKRALTTPQLFSGIGNAYSDEILHAAGLSPLKHTLSLDDAEAEQLYEATRATLNTWIERLRRECAGEFPEKVTAFREGMAVHGRFGQPCPICHSPVQRIVYAENECNYCPGCQTGGRVLADRALSRLLK